jgi:hypothetical protein
MCEMNGQNNGRDYGVKWSGLTKIEMPAYDETSAACRASLRIAAAHGY